MDYNLLSELLFPDIDKDISFYEKKYPERKETFVTRFAPSPTGFIHMGSLYTAYISYLFSKKNNGIFYLRIEDTDQNRKIENGTEIIIKDLKKFNIDILEGPLSNGNYGPYIQSERKNIYKCYAKWLVKNGLAYPCFCTKEELDEIKNKQEEEKTRIGYYGKWAKHRKLTIEEIKDKLSKKLPYVIRLKSNGSFDKKIEIKDLVKGKITFPENDLDTILLKSDGLPTYHFAHVVDDHLMHTTHIIRGDEWLSSIPLHYQLFIVFGFKVPKYAHIAPINKKEGATVRKLSKRHDPECNIEYYYEKGIPIKAMKVYLATLINSNFENWYINNPNEEIYNYNFELNKMSVSGPLFDMEKLLNISKNYFSYLKAEEIYDGLIEFYKKYNLKMLKLIEENKEYTISILNIERNKKRPRKDLSSYSDFENLFGYMYDEFFFENKEKIDIPVNFDKILKDFYNSYSEEYDEQLWTDKIKEICIKYNYATSVKEYNENSDKYNGSITDICTLIRLSVTFKRESPNVYEILKVLGKERIIKRINYFIDIQNV